MKKGLIVHTLILNDKNEVLVLKRSAHESVYPNVWDIPGGTLEDGEDPRVGAQREIREETGLTVNDLNLFAYTSNVDVSKDTQFIRLIFVASSAGGEVKLNPDEHQEYQWISMEQIHTIKTVDYLLRVITQMLSRKSS